MTLRWFALAAAGCIAMGASAQSRTGAPNYDPAKEITIHGTVEQVINAQRGAGTGVHLKLKTADASVDVRLGPARFLEQKNFSFAQGDELAVTGAAITVNGAKVVIAREVKKGDSTLTLRDANGFPLWSRHRRGR